MTDLDLSKQAAAAKALDHICDGMVVGLGTGSTAEHFVRLLSEKKLDIVSVATSDHIDSLARSYGIKTAKLEDYDFLDVDVDGADEIDPDFNLIKGGGGAHTSEKRVAEKSRLFVVIADHTKFVDSLGAFPVAVEFEPEYRSDVEDALLGLGGGPVVREGFVSDRGNMIFDTSFDIVDPLLLEVAINKIEGVVENGIFAKRRPEIVIIAEGEDLKVLRR